MGFLEYVNKQKIKRKAQDTDFIFPICLTKTGNLNTHIQRNFCNFLIQIGVKGPTTPKYDFHSFRKVANVRMKLCGITRDYIDKIAGWLSKDGEGARSYDDFLENQLLDKLELLNYDFLNSEFDYWKKVMSKQ